MVQTVKAKGLRIARGFEMPLELVTEATAIVATRGAGKSSASAVLVEESFALGVQSIIFDRTGVYWGLRSNSTGGGDGLAIYVLGGPHGDVPLEPGAGAMIADLAVDTGHSLVLDLSDFSKAQAIRFAADFLERVYDRKARSRSTMLLVMDEAHFYAPQTPRGGFKGDSARLMGAMEDVVGLGRSRGLGIVLTTQRTQSLNKAILDLIETLIVMRMLSPRARDAVADWIREKQEDDREGVIATLDSLPTGTAWVWSPLRGVLAKVALRRIRTFDSYLTPPPGEVAVEPSARTELDLTALGEQIAATVERAKADDPKTLRQRVAELERALATAEAQESPPAAPVTVEVHAIPPDVRTRVTTLVAVAEGLATCELESAYGIALDVVQAAQDLGAAVEGLPDAPRTTPVVPPRPSRPSRVVPAAPRSKPEAGSVASNGDLKLGRAHRAILTVLAQHPEGRSKRQLALQSGYSEGGGGFNNPLGALRSAGYVNRGEPIVATDDGLAALGEWDPVPTGPALLAHWLGQGKTIGGKAGRAILEQLAAVYPAGLEKAELAERCGYSPEGGGFNNPLGRLRTLGLVDRGAPVCLTQEFGEAIR